MTLLVGMTGSVFYLCHDFLLFYHFVAANVCTPAYRPVWPLRVGFGGGWRGCVVRGCFFIFFMVSIGVGGVVVARSVHSAGSSVPVVRRQSANLLQNSGAKPSGEISGRTKTRLRSLLSNWLCAELPFARKFGSEVHFLTLTFPASFRLSSDIFLKRMLNTFLIDLGRCGVTHWFWVAETFQTGGLHFHLLVNRWSARWSGAWRNLVGSVSGSCIVAQPVRNFPKLVSYILKGSVVRPVLGRLWGMSDTLRDFESVKLDGLKAETFLALNWGNLQPVLFLDFATIYRPTGKLKAKIVAHFAKVRAVQHVLGFGVGSTTAGNVVRGVVNFSP